MTRAAQFVFVVGFHQGDMTECTLKVKQSLNCLNSYDLKERIAFENALLLCEFLTFVLDFSPSF